MASDKKMIKAYGKIADKILNLVPSFQHFTDEQFKSKTEEFRIKLNEGVDLDDLLIEAFAVAYEAIWRVLGMSPYRVQLIGGIILHYGDISEMRTGEGKTLTGILPAYLNALDQKGVHIVTVNEYLSRRDYETNTPVFELLGITTGLNNSQMPKGLKRIAYAQDITYTTNSELGFDYLKDNMVFSYAEKVQRKLNYAIIDEADSILIDEARTPLIISGGSVDRMDLYNRADEFAKMLKDKVDVDIDLESKQVYLTEVGMQRAKEHFAVINMFAVENTELFHLIMNALKANFAFKEGIEYTVRDNEIILIDQFTGRIMEGRAYSDGLQQALQAKEGVMIEEETTTLATITYQNFYRLYAKLAGMTGTAKTEEEEFIEIYNTRVVVTPTNKPIIRKDDSDLTFGFKNATLKKLVEDIKKTTEIGNPILIGTTSVESSEQISHYLDKAGLKYEMINAKNHHREADIVAQAGQLHAITLATNMAGRGTDIKLSEEVKLLGGLHVYGVERNESRRIDNQLRGRSGRQGDPGLSRYYISMEDDLLYRFSSPKMRTRFQSLGEDHIESKIFTRALTNAQKKLEGLNFDQRKNVLDYDNILSQQREMIYAQRDEVLLAEDLKAVIKKFQITYAYELLQKHSVIVHGEKNIDKAKIIKLLNGNLVAKNKFKIENFENLSIMDIATKIADAMMELYLARITDLPDDVIIGMERKTILTWFDQHWTHYLDLSIKLKSGIYLQQYAQNNPLAEYVDQATNMFNAMKISIATDAIEELTHIVLKEIEAQPEQQTIEITDNDIKLILEEAQLTNNDINNETINKRFDELLEHNKDNHEKTKKLNFQRDVLLGLVIELEHRFAAQQNKINDQKEILGKVLSIFGIDSINDLTRETITNNSIRLLEEHKDDKARVEEIKNFTSYLNEILDNIEKIKLNIKLSPEDDPQKTEKVRIG